MVGEIGPARVKPRTTMQKCAQQPRTWHPYLLGLWKPTFVGVYNVVLYSAHVLFIVRVDNSWSSLLGVMSGCPGDRWWVEVQVPQWWAMFYSTLCSIFRTTALCGTYSYQSPGEKYWLGGVKVMRVLRNHTFVFLTDDHSCISGR